MDILNKETTTVFFRTTELSREDRRSAAQIINAAYAEGRKITVDGREVYTWPGRVPAQIWSNGTLSVDVHTKHGNSVTQIWFKEDAISPIIRIGEFGLPLLKIEKQ